MEPRRRGQLIMMLGAVLIAPFLALGAPRPVAAEDGIKAQIDQLNDQVAQKKEAMENLSSKIEHYRDLVGDKKAESASLQDQVALLENRIAKTQISIDITEKQIKAAELEIKGIEEEIKQKEDHMTRQRRLLGALARKLYRKQFGSSMLEMLLAHDSFSSFFDSLYAVAALQHDVDSALLKLQDIRAGLENEQRTREEKRVAIGDRKRALEIDQRKLVDEQTTKENLLAETKDDELRYRYVLAELQREQNDADTEIKQLEHSIREKTDIADRLGSGDTVLSWPVEPTRGLSALFHDPDYPFRNVFEHPAIDIRAYQGTPVRAAAAGIVARAKDAGMGYSYVMLVHTNDISTVYGHLSKIVAKEDTFVERGEVIGYSGGTPGTPGAGSLTTGPHLHFETRLRGIPVNPLDYLVDY